ncbi:MAG: hypothetical protein HQK76_20400 [Desulfobacterales bacterium]|nr:hypothetical protein [Desulfobacterales bacterium]
MEDRDKKGREYHQNYDAIFKWAINFFLDKTLDVLGVHTGKIIEVRGLEPITLDVKEQRVDIFLKDENGICYQIEEERNMNYSDLYRFGAQHLLIAHQLNTDELKSIIITSGVVTPKRSIKTLSSTYNPIIIDLGQRDGEKRLEEIKKQDSIDPIELVFLPMYGIQNKDREEFAIEVIHFARQLLESKRISNVFLGALVVLCNKFVSKETLKKIWEDITMLQIFKDFEEIAMEKGMEKGMEEGMAKGMEEGIVKGMVKATKESISDLLEIKFGEDGIILIPKISKINNSDILIALKKAIKVSKDLNFVKEFIQNLSEQHNEV